MLQPTPTPTAYEPLPPEEPREGLTPQATGVFNLAQTIAWSAVLIALAGVGAMGIYSYKKKPRSKGGINWDNYFKQ